MERFLPSGRFWFVFVVAVVLAALAGPAGRGQDVEDPPEEEPEVVKQLVFIEQFLDTSSSGKWMGSVPSLHSPYDLKVSPDGRHVYVVSQMDDAVTYFARDEETGTLSFAGDLDSSDFGSNVLDGARSLAISPDGAFVYIGSMFAGTSPIVGGNLSAFRRDLNTGALTFLGALYDTDGGIDGLQGVRTVAMSPDGKNLYVSAFDGNGKLSVFSRNATTGVVSFLGVYEEGDQGVAELTDPYDLIVSPDGKHVYVALWKNELIVFEREVGTGLLTYRSRLPYLIAEHTGSNAAGGIRSIATSPGGRFVYVASRSINTITVFERDATTGDLTVESNVRNLVNGVKDMIAPNAITVSADGAYVYVAAFSSDAVVSFERDQEDGSLSYFQSIGAEAEDEWIINGPMSIAASPDGDHVYVGSGSTPHSLTVFRREILVEPPEIVVQPVATSIEEGGSLALHALAQGANVTYQWRRNNADVSGGTLPVLTLLGVSANLDGSLYKVVATNPGGSVESEEVALTVLPPIVIDPPADLTALDISSNSARLVWRDWSDNETNFEIQRRVAGGEFAAIGSVLANQVQYLDTSVAAATTYRYRVRAKRNDDVSTWSNEAVIESFADIPQPPVDLRLVEESYNRVVLGWSDRSAVEDGFRVQRRRAEAGSSWETIGSSEANANRYIDQTVASNAAYAYRVQAYNESGSSDFTNSVVGLTSSIPVEAIAPISRSITRDAASGYTVSVTSSKLWEAVSQVNWLQVTSPQQGRGAGNQTVTYRALVNESQAERIGKIVIGGIEHTVAQAGSPPFLRIQPARTEIGATGGTALVDIQANVAWTASETSDWVSITSGAAGANYGSVALRVEPNTTFERRIATLMINERAHEIDQAAMLETLSLQATQSSFATAGGGGAVQVTANIPWSASVSRSWIRIVGAASGTGDGAFSFAVDENVSFEPRQADILVNDQAISVSQAALVLSDIEPPDLLSIDVSSGLGALVRWRDKSSTETGFLLRRAVVGTERFVNAAILGPNVVEYFDRDAPRGKVVEYRIVGLDAIGRSTEDAMVSERLPASNVTRLVARAEMGGSEGFAYAQFGLAGEGELTLTSEGLGPRLGGKPVGLPFVACTAESGEAIGQPVVTGAAAAVDWSALLGGAGVAFDASRDGVVYGAAARTGEDAYARGVSIRGEVTVANAAIVGGFEIAGSIELPVLLRATGPGLARQYVNDFLADPRLELYRVDAVSGVATLIYANDDWEQWSGAATISLADGQGKAGLGALPVGGKEAQMLVMLGAGRYACVLRGQGAATGVAVLGIYDAR